MQVYIHHVDEKTAHIHTKYMKRYHLKIEKQRKCNTVSDVA